MEASKQYRIHTESGELLPEGTYSLYVEGFMVGPWPDEQNGWTIQLRVVGADNGASGERVFLRVPWAAQPRPGTMIYDVMKGFGDDVPATGDDVFEWFCHTGYALSEARIEQRTLLDGTRTNILTGISPRVEPSRPREWLEMLLHQHESLGTDDPCEPTPLEKFLWSFEDGEW